MVGIWGGISGFRITTINFDAENISVQLELKRSMAKFPKKTKMVYQEDFVPWQTSNIVKGKIAKLKLNVLDWALKSPHLNSMEMLWSILEKKLSWKPVYSRTGLMERLEEEWDNIDEELCIKLIELIPERIQKCLKAKSGHFLWIGLCLCRFFRK